MSNPNTLIVNIPMKHCSGEPGDPLSERVIAILRGLETAGYAPMGFGDTVVLEDCTDAMELQFEYVRDSDTRSCLVTRFIELGGYI